MDHQSPCSPTTGAAHSLSAGMQGLQDPRLIKPSDKFMMAFNEGPDVGSVPASAFRDVERFRIPTQRIYNEHPQENLKLSFPQDKDCVVSLGSQASSKVRSEQSQQPHPCQEEYPKKVHAFPDLRQGQQLLKLQQEQHLPREQHCPGPQPPILEQCVEPSLVSSKFKQLDCSLAAETPLQFQLSSHGTSRLTHAQDMSCMTDHARPFQVHREKALLSPESLGTKSECFQNNMQQKHSDPVPPFKAETIKVHIMAERKRREKLSQRFIALSALLPNLKKTDKATILGDGIKLVKHLQERLKYLEEQASGKRSLPVRPSQAHDPSSEVEIFTASDDPSQQKNVEVRINGKNVLIHMHCKKSKGMLVKLVSELENMNLSVSHTSVFSFSDVALDLTFMAQMEEGYNLTVEYIMKRLNNSLSAVLK